MNSTIEFTQEELEYIEKLLRITSMIKKGDVQQVSNLSIISILQDEVKENLKSSIVSKIIKTYR